VSLCLDMQKTLMGVHPGSQRLSRAEKVAVVHQQPLMPTSLRSQPTLGAVLGHVKMHVCHMAVDRPIMGSQDAMIIGADYYESEDQRSALLAAGRIPIGIGQGSIISNTIVDKNARIGKNCAIVNKEGVEEAVREDEGLYIRSGIVCVLRNAEIADGTQV